MGKKHTVQDIAIGTEIPYATIDSIVIAFNSRLVREMAKSLDGDYQEAVLQVAAGLDEDPGELFLKLDEKLRTTIRSRATHNYI